MTLAERVMKEVAKVFVGKNDIIRKVMLALLAQGVSLAEHAVVERRRGLLRRRGRCRRGGRLGGNGRLTARGDRQ